MCAFRRIRQDKYLHEKFLIIFNSTNNNASIRINFIISQKLHCYNYKIKFLLRFLLRTMKFIRRKESRCCNNIIINLNHRATNYFPLISKIVHRTVTVHDRSSRPRIRVNVYVSREENNKAFSSSYLSPRISSRNCKGPSEWRPGLG